MFGISSNIFNQQMACQCYFDFPHATSHYPEFEFKESGFWWFSSTTMNKVGLFRKVTRFSIRRWLFLWKKGSKPRVTSNRSVACGGDEKLPSTGCPWGSNSGDRPGANSRTIRRARDRENACKPNHGFPDACSHTWDPPSEDRPWRCKECRLVPLHQGRTEPSTSCNYAWQSQAKAKIITSTQGRSS